MARSDFFKKSGPLTIAEIIDLTDAKPPAGSDLTRVIGDIAPFPTAGADDITFLTDRKLLMNAEGASAGACFISPENAKRLPATTIALATPHAEAAFARIIAAFYPEAEYAEATGMTGDAATATVDPTARLEKDVRLEPGVVIGPDAEIGAGTIIGANAVIGRNVKIGRRCLIGPCASILYALIGNHVIVHAGARIGCDGFGYAPGPQGFVKLPQIGRVIIQDHVEIGANTTIDRGALEDTTIGEGAKIDNLVQIAHNVTIGRSSAFAAQVGLSGSTRVGDGVMMGGQSGTIPNVVVGDGAQVAGGTGITGNIAPGDRVAGRPHRLFDQHIRELRAIVRLVRRPPSAREADEDSSPNES